MKQMIWIRKENEADWASITDKSAFVNNAIQTAALPKQLKGRVVTMPITTSTVIAEPKKDYNALLKHKKEK